MEWNYIEKDGNPTKEGLYWVTLIYPEVKKIEGTLNDFEETGKVYANVETRYFGDAKEANGWVMENQPETGLVWEEQVGSHAHERVHAWISIESVDLIANLPEGVVVDNR